MCVILDASARDDVFGKNRTVAGKQFFRWLEMPSARLVLGGKLTEELAGSNSFARWAETAIARTGASGASTAMTLVRKRSHLLPIGKAAPTINT